MTLVCYSYLSFFFFGFLSFQSFFFLPDFFLSWKWWREEWKEEWKEIGRKTLVTCINERKDHPVLLTLFLYLFKLMVRKSAPSFFCFFFLQFLLSFNFSSFQSFFPSSSCFLLYCWNNGTRFFLQVLFLSSEQLNIFSEVIFEQFFYHQFSSVFFFLLLFSILSWVRRMRRKKDGIEGRTIQTNNWSSGSWIRMMSTLFWLQRNFSFLFEFLFSSSFSFFSFFSQSDGEFLLIISSFFLLISSLLASFSGSSDSCNTLYFFLPYFFFALVSFFFSCFFFFLSRV